MNFKLLDMKVFGDERGKLVALEGGKNIPFDIKRVFYIFDAQPGMVRGEHAHRHVEQFVVALNGSCEFVLDDGKTRETILLNRPDTGLYIGVGVWNEMHNFSDNCRLMVLASDYYSEDEYIRDYGQFLKEFG